MEIQETASADLSAFLLRRLERFAALAAMPQLAARPSVRYLAQRAALSAYRDCVALGLTNEATRVLNRVRGRTPVAA